MDRRKFRILFVDVFLGYNQYWPGGFMVLWFYFQEHPKAQPAVAEYSITTVRLEFLTLHSKVSVWFIY